MSSIKSNFLPLRLVARILCNCIGQVQLHAMWLQHLQKNLNSTVDWTWRDNVTGSDDKRRLTIIDSFLHGLYWRLMTLLENYYWISLRYMPCRTQPSKGQKPFDAGLNILGDEKTIQNWENASSIRLKEAIWTCPHPKKHCISPCGLLCLPPRGPSATNHLNCLLVALRRRHWNWYSIEGDVLYIAEMTEILIVMDIICEVAKCFQIPSNVIL